MSKANLQLDLHSIAKNTAAIDEALKELLREVRNNRLKTAEIITGKGSGQLMRRVKKWLAQKEIKTQYKRIEVDAKNHGRLFLHFR